MKPRHFSPRLSLLGGLLCLLIGLLTLSAPSALALSGKIREFATPTAGSVPLEITAGPDGALWFTEINANQIGRISPLGQHTVTELAIPTANSGPVGIAAGPGGTLWFTEANANQIGQVR
jgi:virginiamycin B lyase